MLRKEVRELLTEIRENLAMRYGHERVLELLTKENRRLRESIRQQTTQINKLMDRLMARDFESYANYKETENEGTMFSIGSNIEPIKDESFIGEVIEE